MSQCEDLAGLANVWSVKEPTGEAELWVALGVLFACVTVKGMWEGVRVYRRQRHQGSFGRASIREEHLAVFVFSKIHISDFFSQ